jgi:hypothetical protein
MAGVAAPNGYFSPNYYNTKGLLCEKPKGEAPVPTPAPAKPIVASVQAQADHGLMLKVWKKAMGNWLEVSDQGDTGCTDGSKSQTGSTVAALESDTGVPLTPAPDASDSLPGIPLPLGPTPVDSGSGPESGADTSTLETPNQNVGIDTGTVIPTPVPPQTDGVDGGTESEAGANAPIGLDAEPATQDAPPMKPPVEFLMPKNQLFDVTGNLQQSKIITVPIVLQGQGLHALPSQGKKLVIRLYTNPRDVDPNLPCASGVIPLGKDKSGTNYLAADDGNNIPVSITSYSLTDNYQPVKAPQVDHPYPNPAEIGAVCGSDASGSYVEITIPANFYDLAHDDILDAALKITLVGGDLTQYSKTRTYDFRLQANAYAVSNTDAGGQ